MLVAELYRVLFAAPAAAVVLTGADNTVFFTKDSAGAVGFATTMSFASVGRAETVDSTFSVRGCAGGRLVGLLEVGLTTLSRPCAVAELLKQTAATMAHTENRTIFAKYFKLRTPLSLFVAGGAEEAVILITYY
jgi:hypothetical protein